MKVEPIAGAPALQSQDDIRRLALAALPHLAEGSALLRRCRDLQQRNVRDVGLIWAAARLLTADAALGKQLAKAVLPPRRKAKGKPLQSLEPELNSHSSIFCSPEGAQDSP